MKIAELGRVLDHLQQLYVAAGAKAPAKDLKTLSDLLRPHADRSVDAFVSHVKSRLSRAAERGKPRKNAIAKAAPANVEAVRFHVTSLQSAGTERLLFDQAFNRLKADNSLKLAELAEIAREYADSVTKYKSGGAALNDIAKAFVRQARFANKLL